MKERRKWLSKDETTDSTWLYTYHLGSLILGYIYIRMMLLTIDIYGRVPL